MNDTRPSYAKVAAACWCGWRESIASDHPTEPLSHGLAWLLTQAKQHEAEEHPE